MSAYDEQVAYEPPRRAYMNQIQPPPDRAYNNSYVGEPRAQYEQHELAYQNSAYDYGYDQRSFPQEQAYDEDYGAGYGRPQNGYDQRQERAYDPRYQQRQPRGPPPPQHHQSGPPPSQRRPTPRDARQQGPPQQRDPRQRHDQDRGQPRQHRGQHDQQDAYSAPQRVAGKSSMDEWKAREKARMKKDAQSPEVLPFDNAFPVFGNKNKGSREIKNTSDQRGSGEQAQDRPCTANDPRQEEPRSNGYQTQDDVYMPPRRPDMDRQHSAPDFSGSRQDPLPYDYHENHNSYSGPAGHYPAEKMSTPVGQDYPDQWPMVAGRTPPKDLPHQPSPPRGNRHDPRGAAHVPAALSQVGYTSQSQTSGHQRQPRPRGPPAIDTSGAQQLQRPNYMNHQPLSPANIPPRPATSQGQRPPPNRRDLGPAIQQPQSAVPHNSYDYPGRPFAHEDQGRQGSLDDIYSDYATPEQAPKPLSRAPTTRDEEIESEMPDFDSAAPGQTSRLQKRNEAAKAPAVTPALTRVQTAPPAQMPQSRSAQNLTYPEASMTYFQAPAQSYSAQDVRLNNQQQQPFDQRSARGPINRGPPPRGMTANGYGGNVNTSSAQGRQYDVPYRNMPPQDSQYQSASSDQFAPPQASCAIEPQVRHSFDDARQGPLRQGPQQPQRFYQNGRPPREPPMPQQRSGMAPNGQQPGPNPMTDRNGGLGGQQSMRRPPPPGMANGARGPQSPASERTSSNPDALPHHPVPVRPGHSMQNQPQGDKPASRNGPPSTGRPSLDERPQPVTNAELERLRGIVESSRSPKQELVLVKKLVEAAVVLANEGGRVDAKTAGKNRERFINEAYKRLKKLVALGYPDAQFYMADCHGQGTMGLEVDTKEAFKLYQAAAKSGHAQAAYRTAVCCEMGPEAGGGTSRDYPKAVQWYKRAATLGDAAAMYKIGAVLLKGLLGQPKNIVEAVNWLKRGAEKADKENPHALHELAMLYESTNTNPEIRNKVVADNGYARELFQQAAQLGYKFSQFRLGQAYEYGNLGLTIDNRSSIAWYTKAAAQGEHQAELALSGWYLTGAEGILEHSDTEAYLWARKAASSEPPLAKAMFAMGYFTENGIGCPASLDEARKWYGRAASHRFPKAIERLEELKKTGGKPGSKSSGKPPPMSGKLTRKDQKRDEENCIVM